MDLSNIPNWPLVVVGDDGIRPTAYGSLDECIYCKSKIGEQHKFESVVVRKKVRVKFSVEYEVEEPYSWDEHSIWFHRNESSWCVGNVLHELEELEKISGCLCNANATFEVISMDDTPLRKVNEISN